MRRIATKVDALDKLVLFHVLKAGYEGATAYGKQSGVQFHCALWSTGEIARDQQRPFVADHLQRAGDGATVNFASSHIIASGQAVQRPTFRLIRRGSGK